MLAVPHGLDLVNINLAKKKNKNHKNTNQRKVMPNCQSTFERNVFFFPSLWYQDSSITLRMKKFYN